MKKFFAIILALAMILALAACGSKAADTPASSTASSSTSTAKPAEAAKADPALAGTYACSHISRFGVDYLAADAYENETSIVLEKNGKGSYTLDGNKQEGTWVVANGAITISVGDETLNGSIEKGVIKLTDVDGAGTDMYFATEGADVAAVFGSNEAIPEEPDEESYNEVQKGWNGYWYGWWSISNATGLWEEAATSKDICAQIYVDENGNGTLILWDEDTLKEDTMATVKFTANEADAVSVSGNFMLSEVAPEAWVFSYDGNGYENLITITGQHYEELDGSFDYMITLRPWGL
ncbi:MAG: hypothetical protein MJ135_05685, partial [Oscillospiraceae bacterium]|nr:hypothetical protein [Oscillospiraceae bacterium]